MNEKYRKEIEAFLPFNFPEHVLTDLYEYYRVKEAYIDRHEDLFIHQKFDMIKVSLIFIGQFARCLFPEL